MIVIKNYIYKLVFALTETVKRYSIFENTSKAAFTLAEVLITLGIIGVVAAMTLPSLIQKQNERELVSRLKKFYSTISQAHLQAINENGTPEGWNLIAATSPEGTANIGSVYQKYMKKLRKCDISKGETCWSDKYGFKDYRSYMTLADGADIYFEIISPDCSDKRGNSMQLDKICAAVGIDINGIKTPNKYGEDIFLFYISQENIIPYGTEAETTYSFQRTCNRIHTSDTPNFGCTAWVLFNENRDYLKCDGLSWNGKRNCN